MDKFHTEIPVTTSEAEQAILTNIVTISNGASYTNDIEARLDFVFGAENQFLFSFPALKPPEGVKRKRTVG